MNINNFLFARRFNKKSPVPLYYQLKEIIKENIKNGQYQEGDRLPPERLLAETFSISRMTVRQAMNELVHEGFLVRKPGQGTFVAKPKLVQGLFKLSSFSEDMRSRGLSPSSKVISFQKIQPSACIADALLLKPHQEVFRIERLRLANGEPMALETTHLPASRCSGLSENELATGSLYKLLEEKLGIILDKAQETLEASLANSYEAKLLNIAKGDPVILRERTTYDINELPIEFVKSIYRADRYKFQFLLRND